MQKTPMKKPVLVKISRRKWSRGKPGTNYLLVDSGDFRSNPKLKAGTMCCLGFACRVLGAKPSEIRGREMPDTLSRVLPGLTQDSLVTVNGVQNTKFTIKAAGINDSCNIDDKAREKQLSQLALRHGFKFVFVP